jgi:alpha-N-arabinofuranosidase
MAIRSLTKLCLLLSTTVLCLTYAQAAAPAPPETIVANIDTTKVSEPISKYEHGMFIEHIHSLLYRSLWSEMLDDRKFYFPISSKEPESAGREQGGPFRNMQLRKWRPVGPDEVVVMDKDHPFVGDQSPRIRRRKRLST